MSALLIRIGLVVFRAAMTDPKMKALIEGALLKLFAEIFFQVSSDGKYRDAFMGLAAKLRDPTVSPEEKQSVLLQLQNLHSSLSNPPRN